MYTCIYCMHRLYIYIQCMRGARSKRAASACTQLRRSATYALDGQPYARYMCAAGHSRAGPVMHAVLVSLADTHSCPPHTYNPRAPRETRHGAYRHTDIHYIIFHMQTHTRSRAHTHLYMYSIVARAHIYSIAHARAHLYIASAHATQ